MQVLQTPTLATALRVLVALLILKVTFGIVAGYWDYFPPSFDSEFLRGREAHFVGAYRAAFYAHILSGPLTLLLGLALVSERLRIHFPRLHRSLGKLQGLLVLLVLAPSGLWMAFYAEAVAAVGFAVLAIATGLFVALGWRAAVRRQFEEHRHWMWRCFLLLCSAVVLRLIGGLASVTGIGGEWSYPAAAWVSWLLPLAAFEWHVWHSAGETLDGARESAHSRTHIPHVTGTQSTTSSPTSSLPAIVISARR